MCCRSLAPPLHSAIVVGCMCADMKLIFFIKTFRMKNLHEDLPDIGVGAALYILIANIIFSQICYQLGAMCGCCPRHSNFQNCSLIRNIKSGSGRKTSIDGSVGPANIYRATTDELPQRAYDPEKAKYHLKQAGLDKLAIQFHAADTGFSGAVDAGSLMAESARAAGIDVEVDITEVTEDEWEFNGDDHAA